MRTEPFEFGWNSQRGFTLIEIMIALLIGVFLMAALLTIVQTNRAVFGNQSQLAQLQDSERMAMTMTADVIQSAGYFPDPIHNTQASVLSPSGLFTASGQAIYGTHSTTPPGDTIYVRYMTASGDGILNCSGLANTSGANTIYINQFQVANGQLVCILNGATTYNLVSGVTNGSTDVTNVGIYNMTAYYGVKTIATAAGNNVDTYLTADQVSDWTSVISVLIELTFTNPLYTTGSTTQPKTILIQRVVGVMNLLGPVEQ